MIRKLEIGVLLLLMAGFGVGVYGYLGTLKQAPRVSAHAAAPIHTKPRFVLPGTMFFAQAGAIYRLQDGEFTQIASGNWSQPTVTPDHSRLIAVSRQGYAADLYLLDLSGHVIRQLTHNTNRYDVSSNHWSFFPRVSPDGQTLFYSWDPKDPNNGYRVDLAVYAMPLNGSQSRAREWTYPYFYSGGDLEPTPLTSGQLLYVKYDVNDQGQVYARLWLTQRAGAVGRPLTAEQDDCTQFSLSPDGKTIAMICSGGQQVGRLEIASFDGTNLGPATVLVDGQLAASPAWSPQGSGIAYMAATGPSGHFQLYYIPIVPAAAPTAAQAAASPLATAIPTLPPVTVTPLQVSIDLDLDTTASPAWY